MGDKHWRFQCPKCQGSWFGTYEKDDKTIRSCHDQHYRGCHWQGSSEECRKETPYTTDYNAMAEVWKVLKERGLWDEFLDTWHGGGLAFDAINEHAAFWCFLNDLPGQVEAAIKVLERSE